MNQNLIKEEWYKQGEEELRRREKFEKELIEAFPLFWRKIGCTQSDSYYPNANVGSGWFGILWDCCAAIEKELNTIKYLYPVEYLPFPSQIKEKFGTLRFYYDSPEELPESIDRSLEAAIVEAEHCSATTCELCGKAGKIRGKTLSGKRIGWIKTLCNNCWKKGN